jgi:threonine synthase
MVSKDEHIVLLNTGNGLKDIAGAMKAIEQTGRKALTVDSSIHQFLAVWNK